MSIKENIEWVKQLDENWHVLRAFNRDIGMFLIEEDKIVSCIDIKDFKENFSLLKMSMNYVDKDKTFFGMKIVYPKRNKEI